MGNMLKKCLRSGSTSSTQLNHRKIEPNHVFSHDMPDAQNPNSKYLSNRIKTTKYTLLSFIPKNLFEQFHRFANLYFIFIVLLNWVPQVNAFGKEIAMIPVIFVLAVTAFKDGFEDYRRFKSDKKINNLQCRVYSKNEKRYISTVWSSVQTGDTVHLSCNEVIPADILLLRSSDEDGFCYIDTSNIDGENNLKQRNVVRRLLQQGHEFQPTMFTHSIECEVPNMEIHKFHGKIVTKLQEKIPLTIHNLLLRGCIIRNTDFVEGIVVYAGHDTKALLNNSGPRYKRSKLERLINRDVIWCILLLLFTCLLSALGTGLWLGQWDVGSYPIYLPPLDGGETSEAYVAFIRFWTFVILYQVLIPLSLYVSVELIKVGQVYFIERDIYLYHQGTNKRVECRALNITEELGQVEYIFSDKTGTLTENKMVFKFCCINGINYGSSTLKDMPAEDYLNMSMESFSTTTTYGLRDDQRDARIDTALSSMKISNVVDVTVQSHQYTHVQEFFLLLAICNTVVISAAHVDIMDQQGDIHQTARQMHSLVDSVSIDPSIQTNWSQINGSYKDVSLERYTRLSESGASEAESPSYLEKFSFRNRNRSKRFDNESNYTDPPSDHDASINDLSFSSAFSDTAASNARRKLHYEAESPDELALVHAAANYRCRLVKRTLHYVVVYMPGEGDVRIDVRHVLPFDSRRRRMSIIFEHPTTGDIVLYTKGADSAIFCCLRHLDADDTPTATIRQKTQEHLDHYARQGFRTLCMAKKVMTMDEYKSWLQVQDEAEVAMENRERLLYDSACAIEQDMELIGATGIEDRLQDGVPETITALRTAGIKLWVLTGDKQETALNIARSCNLISFDHDLIILNEKNLDTTQETIKVHLRRLTAEGHQLPDTIDQNSMTCGVEGNGCSTDKPREVALVVDGKTLMYVMKNCEKDFLTISQMCNSVICCRTTPFQKAEVVKLVRNKLKKVTLAIGDGANDVNMIQTSDIGIGISGQEGMQAVMASDFSLPRFRFIKRLLLVHGHWCYDRLARMALYTWYKNSSLIFMLIWYQIYTAFSGQSMIDDVNLIVFLVLYSSLPAISLGIFDQCIDDRSLMSNPTLYRETQGYNVYKRHSYWILIADSVYQSLVAFFVPFAVYYDTNTGIWEFGTTMCSSILYCNLVHICIETKHWNIFHILSIVLSLACYYATNIIMALVCTACGPRSSIYGVFFVAARSPTHWLSILLVLVIAMGPRFCVRALQGSLCPSRCVQAQRNKPEVRPQPKGAKIEQSISIGNLKHSTGSAISYSNRALDINKETSTRF